MMCLVSETHSVVVRRPNSKYSGPSYAVVVRGTRYAYSENSTRYGVLSTAYFRTQYGVLVLRTRYRVLSTRTPYSVLGTGYSVPLTHYAASGTCFPPLQRRGQYLQASAPRTQPPPP